MAYNSARVNALYLQVPYTNEAHSTVHGTHFVIHPEQIQEENGNESNFDGRQANSVGQNEHSSNSANAENQSENVSDD